MNELFCYLILIAQILLLVAEIEFLRSGKELDDETIRMLKGEEL